MIAIAILTFGLGSAYGVTARSQTIDGKAASDPSVKAANEELKKLKELLGTSSADVCKSAPDKCSKLIADIRSLNAELEPISAKTIEAAKTCDDPDGGPVLDCRNLAHCKPTSSAEPPTEPWGRFLYDQVQRIQIGADGPATVLSDCTRAGLSREAGGAVDPSASLIGATGSLQYDGIQKKQTETFRGAIGYTPKLFEGKYGKLTLYGKIDNENQDVIVKVNNQQKPQISYTENLLEFGAVYRTPLSTINPDPRNDHANEVYDFIYIQPFYTADFARHSELEGLNLRFVPLHGFLNEYNDGPYFGLADNYNGPDKGVGNVYYGLLLDGRLDAAHFGEAGTPLGAPVTPAQSKNVVGNPYFLPNEDYVRVGGRIGVFGQYYAPKNWTGILGDKPYFATIYYKDFWALAGIRHGFGEAVGQISYPITSSVSVAASFINGRSENVAAREQSWTIGVKLGGGN